MDDDDWEMKSLALILLISLSCITLRAETIYSTLGPDPYMPNSPYFFVGWDYTADSGIGVGRAIASQFSFTGSPYQLNSITLDIGLDINERTPNLQIGISYDEGGHPSPTAIALLEPNPTLITSVQRTLHTYSFSMQIILQPNTAYWLTLQPRFAGIPDESLNGQYNVSSSILNPQFPIAARDYNDGWPSWNVREDIPAPVFSLDGAAVPEPSTWALLTVGGALAWFAARRRRK